MWGMGVRGARASNLVASVEESHDLEEQEGGEGEAHNHSRDRSLSEFRSMRLPEG